MNDEEKKLEWLVKSLDASMPSLFFPILTVPAFSENIAGEDYPENNPGIYSILEVNEGRFILRNYSRKYVFDNVELDCRV